MAACGAAATQMPTVLVCFLAPGILTALKVFPLRLFFLLVTQPLLFVGSLLPFLLSFSSFPLALVLFFFFSFFSLSYDIFVGKATYKFHTKQG